MTSLTQTSFLIPISIDCEERRRNFIDQINFLRQFDTNIYIAESDELPKLRDLIDDTIHYKFIQSNEFSRTKLVNLLARDATTPVITIHDIDAFVPKQQCVEALQSILDDKFDFCYPYTIWQFITKYVERLMPESHALNSSVGGSVFCRRTSFFAAGMENENFVSWGEEDCERYARWQILGYRIGRIDGELYHADHPRGFNSSITNSHYTANLAEINKITAMPCEELLKYVNTWPWLFNQI